MATNSKKLATPATANPADFTGWTTSAFDFFDELSRDNSKAYFEAHKSVYQEEVHRPMAQLLAILEPEFGKGKIFRIYRDVRFSADKTPYKTNIAATVGSGLASYYLDISREGLFVAAGIYAPPKEQVDAYRKAVDAEKTGQELEKIVAKLAKLGRAFDGQEMKAPPRGFSKDHPRIDLLKHKHMTVSAHGTVQDCFDGEKVVATATTLWREATPLLGWLNKNMVVNANA